MSLEKRHRNEKFLVLSSSHNFISISSLSFIHAHTHTHLSFIHSPSQHTSAPQTLWRARHGVRSRVLHARDSRIERRTIGRATASARVHDGTCSNAIRVVVAAGEVGQTQTRGRVGQCALQTALCGRAAGTGDAAVAGGGGCVW